MQIENGLALSAKLGTSIFADDSGLWRDLLDFNEVIRDPVHRDIDLSSFELELINQPQILRLIDIKQLGLTYLVYPGALHNRFLHGIGTLYVAQQIIDSCNRNASRYPVACHIDKYSQFVIRLSCLLHDAAHIPFGHTLEDEMNLFPPQWKDTERKQLITGPKSKLFEFVRAQLYERGVDNAQFSALMKDVEGVLLEDQSKSSEPFIIDVVSNTICADLIDYVYRDIYFTGLNQQFGDRFIRNLAVLPLARIFDKDGHPTGEFSLDPGKLNPNWKIEGERETPAETQTKLVERGVIGHDETVRGPVKKRLALLLYRFDKTKKKFVSSQSALSEAIDLIRQRYSLAEKVYFHRTKIAASAMLGAAVASSALTSTDLYVMSDNDLLNRLGKLTGRTSRLAENLVDRRLYKPIFERGYSQQVEGSDPESKALHSMKQRYRDKNTRSKLETYLEDTLGLMPGSVAVYCPPEGMNLKHFLVLVQGGAEGRVKPLEKFLSSWRQREIASIKENHMALWKFRVFVDPTQADPSRPDNPNTKLLAGLIASTLQLSNSIDSLQGYWVPKDEAMADVVIEKFRQENPLVPVTVEARQQLIDSARRGDATIASVMDQLRRLTKSQSN